MAVARQSSSFDPHHALAADGMPRSSIRGLPTRGEAAFKDEASKTGQFCEKVRQMLAAYPNGGAVFNQVDISKVHWSASSVDFLFRILAEKSVKVDRLRAFECGLDDGSLQSMAAWLKNMPAMNLPSEIHLSHNRITPSGLAVLVEAIENRWAQLFGKRLPVWLRVEGNPVDDFSLCGLVASGRAVFATSCNAPERWNSCVPLAFPSFWA
ncbi:unnamed protein product [Polarella glacialis]|uniref:Uncharacterized protein n=1 Tax=Polarella glacialis TaxID=89957 RepID=A0A813GDS8_POLGL|nr:unnamed protein product [Polarella glacialis]